MWRFRNDKGRILFCCGIIACITFIVFFPSLNNDFTNWDDGHYVTDNPDIKGVTPRNLTKILSSNYVGLYQPLTMLTYMAEYRFFHLNPTVYHCTNLILHIINAILVFALIYGLSGSYLTSLLVGLLFAVHPMRVESVAWIAERKDVLSAFFYFLSLLFYVRYTKNGGRKFYWFCALALVFSLLSKPMAVSQPFVLLLIDYLCGKRLNKRALLAKVPFFALVAVFAVAAFSIQMGNAPDSRYDSLSIIKKICVPFYGMVFYLFKSIAPVHLSAYYPFPEKTDIVMNSMLFASPFLVSGAAAAVYYFRTRSRTLVFGSLFFFITVLPVLQIVRTGAVIVAERYTYIPMVGIYLLFAALYGFLFKNKLAYSNAVKSILVASLSILMVVFACITYARCGVWKDSLSLWNDCIAKYPVAAAYNNRGNFYNSNGNYDRAIEDFNRAIVLDSQYSWAYYNRGLAYHDKGDFDRAINDYTKAIRFKPSFSAVAFYNRGKAYTNKSDYDHAIEDFNQAIRLNPRYFEAYDNRGVAYCAKGDYDHAIEDHTDAIRLNPRDTLAYNDRGFAYSQRGDFSRAIEDYTQAVRLNPTFVRAYNNRGIARKARGDFDGAIEDFTEAIKINSTIACGSYCIRGMIYCYKGDYDRGIEDFSKAIKLNPQDGELYYYRGLAYKARGDVSSAADDFRKACDAGFAPACKEQ
jgi:tetratricopeptide (TPR) repeat protein